MALGLIVNSGRILTAKLLLGKVAEGLTHCAIGDGDDTFTDPMHPPDPDIDQLALKNERARKRWYKRTFLKQHPQGTIIVNGLNYIETGEETNIIGVFFRFNEDEANGITIKEYGFFGGDCAYLAEHTDSYAINGVFHMHTNPTGEVLRPGYLYEVKNIPDFNKFADTRVEIVGVIKV